MFCELNRNFRKNDVMNPRRVVSLLRPREIAKRRQALLKKLPCIRRAMGGMSLFTFGGEEN